MRTVPTRLSALAATGLLVAAGLLVSACDKIAPKPEDPNAAKVAEAAANPNFSVSASAEPILALQVLVTNDTVSVQDARFMRAPLRKGDGQPDLLVLGMAGDRIVHRYPIPDPLEGQIEPTDKGLHGTMKLPQASVWIYMPATRFDVIEISPGRDDKTLPRGGRIEVGPVLAKLCPGDRRVEDCAEAAISRGDQNVPPPTTQPGATGDPATGGPVTRPPLTRGPV